MNWLAKILFKLATGLSQSKNVKDNNLQKLKEHACIEEGHLWTAYKDPNKQIKNRMYCRRCGQMYHEHQYINTVIN